MQLYDALILPPANHFQKGALLVSSTLRYGLNHVSMAAYFLKQSGNFSRPNFFRIRGSRIFAGALNFAEGCVTGVEHLTIRLEPRQHGRVFFKTVGEFVETELFQDSRISHIRLRFEFCRGTVILLFLPMHGNLSFADFCQLRRFFCVCHDLPPSSGWLSLSSRLPSGKAPSKSEPFLI